jgi:hypothetical protein
MEASALALLRLETEGYRTVGGAYVDLKPWNWETHLKESATLYQQNHAARRLIGMIVDFVVGDGITVTAKDADTEVGKQVQSIIDEFWTDPSNRMDRLNPRRVSEWQLWGEICMPILTDENGNVRLGWINPSVISRVVPDPVSGQPSQLIIDDSYAKQIGSPTLDVLRFDASTGKYTGSCVFAQIHALFGGERGVSELYTSRAWLEAMEQTLKAGVDRGKLAQAFIWDVKLEGYGEGEIKKWLRENGVSPKPGSVRAHNEKVTWTALAPALNAGEFEQHLKTLKSYIMGGHGVPNHWFGSGDDANLATAEVMSEPTRKMLRSKQKEFRELLTDVMMFVIQRKVEAGILPEELLTGLPPFDVVIPDVGGPDTAKVGAALEAMTRMLVSAIDAKLVSEQTARQIFAALASDTGVEIDVAAEAKQIEAEQVVKKEESQAQDEKQQEFAQQALRAAASVKATAKPGE